MAAIITLIRDFKELNFVLVLAVLCPFKFCVASDLIIIQKSIKLLPLAVPSLNEILRHPGSVQALQDFPENYRPCGKPARRW